MISFKVHHSVFPKYSFVLCAFLLVAALVSACSDADNAVQDPEAEEDAPVLESVTYRDVFLRVVAPLDEARGYCLDIPGHSTGVRVDSPLQAQTCKHVIWNQDGRFDVSAPGNGALRMPQYDLCLGVESASVAAQLVLPQCTGTDLQTWTVRDSGEIVLESFPQMCITIEDVLGRDAGGPQYLIKGVGLDMCTPLASDRQQWTTVVPQ